MRLISCLAAAGALMMGTAVARPISAGAQEHPSFAGLGIPHYHHIFVIMMENHSYDQVIGNRLAPHINALAQTYGLATAYYGVTHPSEPNYVASIGGDYFGIQDDAPYATHTIDAPSLASQLEAAGLSWKTYQQALPYAGYTGTRYPNTGPTLYASKHNPFLNFASVQSNPTELQKIVPDSQLATDLRIGQVPNLAYIVPDQCHDMHGTTGCADDASLIPAGDAYVDDTVSLIMGSRVWREANNAIVVTWDEDDFSPTNLGCCDANPGGGHVVTIVINNHGPRAVQDSTPSNHYSLLQTIQDAFHLGCLRFTCDTANVRPLAALFTVDGASTVH
jgi:phospholipase C